MNFTIGQEVYHPKHGTLALSEWNDHGQLFCFDEDDKFYLFNAKDKGVVIFEDEEGQSELTPQEQRAEEIRNGQIAWALDPESMGILIQVNEDDTWDLNGRNLTFEEMFLVVQQIFSQLSQQPPGASVDRN